MLGDLSHCDDGELLGFIATILSRPGDVVTAYDLTEIQQIALELEVRDLRCMLREGISF